MSKEKIECVFEKLSKEEYTIPEADTLTERSLFEIQAINYAVFHLLWSEIANHDYENAIQVVEDFKKEMDDFACIAKTGTSNLIFSAAYDVANYVLDSLLA